MFLKNFIYNQIMINGNKTTSESLFLKSLKKIQKSEQKNSKDIFKIGLIQSSPVLYIKHIKRKRKRTVEFPFLLTVKNRLSYGVKFILQNTKQQTSNVFYKCFHEELVLSTKQLSKSVKRKTTIHQESFVKKKFSNYRWF